MDWYVATSRMDHLWRRVKVRKLQPKLYDDQSSLERLRSAISGSEKEQALQEVRNRREKEIRELEHAQRKQTFNLLNLANNPCISVGYVVELLLFCIFHSLALDDKISWVYSIVFLSLMTMTLLVQLTTCGFLLVSYSSQKQSDKQSLLHRHDRNSFRPRWKLIPGCIFFLSLIAFNITLILYHMNEMSPGGPLYVLAIATLSLALFMPGTAPDEKHAVRIASYPLIMFSLFLLLVGLKMANHLTTTWYSFNLNST
eukprot:TRINITY_DN9692_c0_g1_i1.p1 TRINITY_DN9692_c0_g1~~TRINITY_DN9692_c0_g1_i1.p1  ORF type:complete len:256 (-),score=47.84 TRINITY_DN9692_c0_g1_i1:83-850(-)